MQEPPVVPEQVFQRCSTQKISSQLGLNQNEHSVEPAEPVHSAGIYRAQQEDLDSPALVARKLF